MIKATKFSFGGTAAIVTNMALIIGLDAATATKSAIVSGLLIVALADNLTDSLSIHIYQEAERLEARDAFRSTLTNFATRLLVSLTFVLLVLALPVATAALVSVIWGVLLLVVLSIVIARQRLVSAASEVVKHLTAAAAVLLVSHTIGAWIPTHFG